VRSTLWGWGWTPIGGDCGDAIQSWYGAITLIEMAAIGSLKTGSIT